MTKSRNTAYKKIIQAGNTREITKTIYKSNNINKQFRKNKNTPSPAWIKRYNARIRAKKTRIIVNNNFTVGDYFITLTYSGKCPTQESSDKALKIFCQWIRRKRKRNGTEFKYIISTEGSELKNRQRIHHHMIINNDGDIEEILNYWIKNNGVAVFRPIYSVDLCELSDYMTKSKNESYRNIRHSRNLVIPVEELEEITLKELIEEASPVGNKIPKPSNGYYILKDSITRTINPITGAYAIHYREIKLQADNTHKPYIKRKRIVIRQYKEPYCYINAEGRQESFLI